ncbi:adenosylcobalamin-dependent ribonucleoside-diphosphate reductase [Escherichia coli]|nr:adenosylcobalamin-dependent ribonucleoside-diphosphate reductase [Escherichia coli]
MQTQAKTPIDLSIPQPISIDVLLEKYAKGDEQTQAEIFARVAQALASVEADPSKYEQDFLFALENGFIPAGRIMSAAGTGIKSTLMNCFVQPVGDSFSEFCERTGKPGIYTALAEAGETMRRGGGIGYCFSDIRPKNSLVKGTQSYASGPVSFMRVFDKSCATVESAGSRRGAQMGVLKVSHPDIREFIRAKRTMGELTNFNVSVGVSDAFMEAVEKGASFKLVHAAEPSAKQIANGAYQEDGVWVYEEVNAAELYDEIMALTYDFAEPGILFLDRMNQENNLRSIGEVFEATNPCAEQPLPSYGCCDLGSVNLARMVLHVYSAEATVDWKLLGSLVTLGVRMLDNVLDLTFWPLEKQRIEAMNKRRIGLGFTALGNALAFLCTKYNSHEGRAKAAEISEFMRDTAYRASIELAKEKGAFPLFDAEKYLQSPFIQRLPDDIKEDIRKYGIRNSHLLSIAPTGTISLSFCDNASNGIEPPFTWFYDRNKRMPDGSQATYRVYDHAYRVWLAEGGSPEDLPPYFVSALEMSAQDHMAMLEAVQPYVDTSISKTVNVPEDYPFDDFKGLYMEAWKGGLKGLATYRPSDVRGAVLVAPTAEKVEEKPDFDDSDPDRRVKLDKLPEPALASLRWNKRPVLPAGNPSWTYMVKRPDGHDFAVMVGHVEGVNGSKPQMLEVWVNGSDAPRGLGAIAKSLSMDMRSEDTSWLKAKLESLQRVAGEDGFEMPCPFDGAVKFMPSSVAALASIVKARCEQLGIFEGEGASPIFDSLMSPKEPKTGTDGTMAWAVDVSNPATGDDLCMFVKELVLPDGTRRPYSVWLAGSYPRVLDGLCKSLSFDMRVVDPAWVGAKLRQIADFSEVRGDFFGKVPGSNKSENQPSTIAYLAKLILHRYAMLGVLDDDGFPVQELGFFYQETDAPKTEMKLIQKGSQCAQCMQMAVIKKDGCDFCTNCGEIGSCG